MKKMPFVILAVLFSAFFGIKLYAAEYGYVPDVPMITTPAMEISEFENGIEAPVIEYNSGENAKDPRTLNEKMRAKLHLPPTKKIYYHNIDKSKQPITVDQYYKLSAEKKRKDFEIPNPDFNDDEKMITPEHQFRVIRYNSPPGRRNINIGSIIAQKAVSSPGILSPDNKKFVYTKCFFYPEFRQTSSAAYFIPVDYSLSDTYEILYKSNVVQGDIAPIFTIGADEFVHYRFMTLFPLDWSKDSTKIAFKEKTGSNLDETWQTNIVVYDFNTKKLKRLSAVREAIIYYWRENKNIDLKNYMWDIFPAGWDKKNDDRIIVYAFAYTNDKPLFLGTWSIDSEGNKSLLESLTSTDAEIEQNGFGLKEIKYEH